uniref:Uncharacterized protein n=1 Tax=Anguilla anguilla TaxID=7936 RepID=A0A0E9V8W0_ANGAN
MSYDYCYKALGVLNSLHNSNYTVL